MEFEFEKDYDIEVKGDKIVLSDWVYEDKERTSKLTNTGNGVIVKFYSYSSMSQDNYVCMNYDEICQMYALLKAHFMKSENVVPNE